MKPRVATAWLGGCSGCHMSFLDLDERLIELADKIELVYSPIADVKEFPKDVDVTLVEGAVANSENEEMAHIIRKNSRIVMAFGDCATTGNVTAMRNSIPLEEVERRSYIELADKNPRIPDEYVTIAQLLKTARPLHEVICHQRIVARQNYSIAAGLFTVRIAGDMEQRHVKRAPL